MLAHQHTRASAPPTPSPIRAERAAKRSARATRSPDRQQGSGSAAPRNDIADAKAWLAAARECGLVVFPWLCADGRISMAQCGQEMDGPNDFSSATERLLGRPEAALRIGLPDHVLRDVICADFQVDPADPDLRAKVDARLDADHAARQAAGGAQ